MAFMETARKTKEPSRPAMSAPAKEVEFAFHAPMAKKVSVAGKFNNWNTSSMPLRKEKDGTWKLKMKLAPGRYEYKYFVDDAWAQDAPSSEKVPNPFGTLNCVMTVK